MKKLITIIFLLCGMIAKSQIYLPSFVSQYGENVNRLKPLIVQHLPVYIGDTSLQTTDTSAQIRINDGKLQYHYKYWRDLGSGSVISDSLFYDFLDSTGISKHKVIYSKGGHFAGDTKFLWDETDNQLMLGYNTVTAFSSIYKLAANGSLYSKGLTLDISVPDANNYLSANNSTKEVTSKKFTGLVGDETNITIVPGATDADDDVITFIGTTGGSTPALQAVTDVGSTTNNSITSSNNDGFVVTDGSSHIVAELYQRTSMPTGGALTINNTSGDKYIQLEPHQITWYDDGNSSGVNIVNSGLTDYRAQSIPDGNGVYGLGIKKNGSTIPFDANGISDLGTIENAFTETIERFTGSTSSSLTTAHTPLSGKAEIVYINGIAFDPSNVTIVGTSVTISGITRETSDIITIKYSY